MKVKVKVCLNDNCKEYRYGSERTKFVENLHICPECGLILQKETITPCIISIVKTKKKKGGL